MGALSSKVCNCPDCSKGVRTGATGTAFSAPAAATANMRVSRQQAQAGGGLTELDKLRKVLTESALPAKMMHEIDGHYNRVMGKCTSDKCKSLGAELTRLSPFMLGRSCSNEVASYRCKEIVQLENTWGQLKNECVRLDPTCANDLRALGDYYSNEFSGYGCDAATKIDASKYCRRGGATQSAPTQSAPAPEIPNTVVAPDAWKPRVKRVVKNALGKEPGQNALNSWQIKYYRSMPDGTSRQDMLDSFNSLAGNVTESTVKGWCAQIRDGGWQTTHASMLLYEFDQCQPTRN